MRALRSAFRSVMSGIGRSPLKSTLTLLTVGLGVGVLVFALSISSAFSRLLERQLEQDGIVVMVSNAEVSESTGELEEVRPPQFDEDVLEVLSMDVEGVVAVAPVGRVPWSELVAGQTTYRIRSIAATDQAYAELMNLELLSGANFTAPEVRSGARKALVSESLATVMFGSPEAAVGQTLKTPSPSGPSAPDGQSQGMVRTMVMPTFTVAGVFRDVGELARQAYGVPDMIVPYTAVLPQGGNAQM